jgi:hypothetical protein
LVVKNRTCLHVLSALLAFTHSQDETSYTIKYFIFRYKIIYKTVFQNTIDGAQFSMSVLKAHPTLNTTLQKLAENFIKVGKIGNANKKTLNFI